MIDNASKYDLTTVGSTQISTINKKYGTGSIFFNGTTDYILVGNPSAFVAFPPVSSVTTTSQNAIATQVVLLTAQSATIVDNGTGNSGVGFTLVNNGTVTATNSVIPFSGTYSYSFNGSSQYLTWAPGSTAAFGTGDFTVEAWVNMTAAQNAQYIVDFRNTGQTTSPAFLIRSTTQHLTWFNGSTYVAEDTSTTRLGTNSWHHVAFVRSSSVGYLYVDGVQVATSADATNYSTSPTLSYIGRYYNGDANDWPGYISNFRIVKGTALYSSTSDLTGSFVTPPVLYNGQFTIEAWIYITSYSTMCIYSQFSTLDSTRFWFGIDNSLGYKLVFYHGTSGNTFGNTAIPLAQWNHVAVSRDATNRLLLFLNGVIDGSAANYTSNLYQLFPRIGNLSSNTNYFNGYIDDLRVSLIARYTTNFTVPTKYLDT
jgi:hypothetical protein